MDRASWRNVTLNAQSIPIRKELQKRESPPSRTKLSIPTNDVSAFRRNDASVKAYAMPCISGTTLNRTTGMIDGNTSTAASRRTARDLAPLRGAALLRRCTSHLTSACPDLGTYIHRCQPESASRSSGGCSGHRRVPLTRMSGTCDMVICVQQNDQSNDSGKIRRIRRL